MKDEIKAHFTSGPERLSRWDHEFEMIDFFHERETLDAKCAQVAAKVPYRVSNPKGTND
jgi:hypothetical protein